MHPSLRLRPSFIPPDSQAEHSRGYAVPSSSSLATRFNREAMRDPTVSPIPMIPRDEADTLMMTVTDAIDFAADGQVADGYAALVWGLHRAEEMVDNGESADVRNRVARGS